ncbi:uncharacterized protein BDV17DRAFT_144599 [Aspergillus undulatus]|uniref:uncharacterized protein n=1 Tax=Aspergillus undulatus TaxID=1810928 RepID=UPI003CCDA7B5
MGSCCVLKSRRLDSLRVLTDQKTESSVRRSQSREAILISQSAYSSHLSHARDEPSRMNGDNCLSKNRELTRFKYSTPESCVATDWLEAWSLFHGRMIGLDLDFLIWISSYFCLHDLPTSARRRIQPFVTRSTILEWPNRRSWHGDPYKCLDDLDAEHIHII